MVWIFITLYYWSHYIYYVTVWIQIISASTFFVLRFSLFFFFFLGSAAIVDFVNCEQCIRALFTVPQITLFSNFFIKNRSHSTIYTFKNYFATVFSISVFSFSKNKLNPNGPLIYIFFRNTRKLYLYLQLYKSTEEKNIERSPTRIYNIKYLQFPLFFIHGLYCIEMTQNVLTTVISRKLATLGRCFFP